MTIQPSTELKSIKKLGSVYLAQTEAECGGHTVACLVNAVAPLFESDEPTRALKGFLVQCAKNPRAHQNINGYTVPPANTAVIKVLVNVLKTAVKSREEFPDPKPSLLWMRVLDSIKI